MTRGDEGTPDTGRNAAFSSCARRGFESHSLRHSWPSPTRRLSSLELLTDRIRQHGLFVESIL